MLNPYEPPQAIESPPVAELAPTNWPLVVETPQLPRAAANCAWAGQMLFIATLAAVLLVISDGFDSFFAGLVSAEFVKNLGLMSGLSMALLLVGGACKNMIGYVLFFQRSPDRATVVSYQLLFMLGLLKGAVLAGLGLVFFSSLQGSAKYWLWSLLLILVGLLFHTILLQAKTLRRWQVLLARPFARGWLEAYKYLNLAALVVFSSQAWYTFQERREPLPSVVIGALLLYAGALVAYSRLYRQLETALKATVR